MNSQLTERIYQNMSRFSKGQKRIARYITDHYDEVAFMTAVKLGNTVGVSESTVVRFAAEIGYSGYPALQRAIQEMIRSKLTSLQRLEMTVRDTAPEAVLDTVFHQDVESIRRTIEELDRADFHRAVDAVVKAKKVFILGVRSSSALATFLAHYFHLILEDVHLVNASSEAEIFEQILRVGKEDALIGISFPRYSRKVSKAMQFALDRGAKVIAITDSAQSPPAQASDFLLLGRSGIASIVDSLVAPLSLINAFIVTAAIRKQADLTEQFRELESIWDEYGVYEKVDEKEF